jgi:hypothetical protein
VGKTNGSVGSRADCSKHAEIDAMTMMLTVYDQETHYPILCEWWLAHGWTPMGPDFLPSQGYVIEDVCAGFLYCSDSRVAMIEWVVSNPEAAPRKVVRGLKVLLKGLQNLAAENDYTAVFSFVQQPRLQKLYESTGFVTTDENMIHLVWRN